MRSVYDSIKVAKAVSPARITGTGTPTAAFVSEVDTFGYNSALFNIAVGTSTGTAASFVVSIQIQESATSGGTFTNISGATGTITGTTTAAHLQAQVRVEGLGTGRQRYLKVTPTVTRTPNDGTTLDISAVCLLGRAFKNPPDNAATATL